MVEVRSAAVYARISQDAEGTMLGVARQLEDCRKLARELGWEVGGEYVDNDVSAYKRKPRPEYERMLADLADGTRDAVLAYHTDRLTRRPIEFERFLEVLEKAGVRHVDFVAGPGVDVVSGDGMLLTRLLAIVAANESDTKSRRVKRKMEEIAMAGLPLGGGHRFFGYEDDRITIVPTEAAIIRDLVARFIAGESLRSITLSLTDSGVPTIKGGPWRSATVKQMICSARNAGLREYNGEIVATGVWEPIFSTQDRDRVLARFEAFKNSARRTPRRYLLSGALRCGTCGERLYSSARKASRRYVCIAGPDHGGCGRLTIVAAPLEELVTDAVLYRLDTTELADTLAGRAAQDAHTAALSEEITNDRQQLVDIMDLYTAKRIGRDEWLRGRDTIQGRITTNEKRLSRMTRTDALNGLVGNGEKLRGQWESLNLTRQAAIVNAVIDHVVIAKGVQGSRELNPSRVNIIWRF